MNLILNCLLLVQGKAIMNQRGIPDHLGNFVEQTSNSFVVGIPLSASTVYLDSPIENRNCYSPVDLNNRLRNNTSFQITSVTVQGSRTNNEDFEDSADDFDESHTDDISSDILDSSKVTEHDGYQSEDTTNANFDDLSPCGPLIITPLSGPTRDSNMNVGLGINMSPPFPTMASNMMSSGVTMMTSSSESPVSAQVPIINSLPDNWQHRFKVVKIVSSEPFKRGRWLCMDFKDPPQSIDANKNDQSFDVPAIQVTPCSFNSNVPPTDQNHLTHVFGIPVSSDVPVCEHNQPIYGIFVPHENYAQNSAPINVGNALNLNQNIVYSQNSALPFCVQENNAKNSAMENVNVPVDFQKLNGHDPDICVLPFEGNARVLINPVLDKPVIRSYSQEGNESTAPTGTSTVAIDNKIEQAMDLVKSHLMFAVREEVEVLKEKITELLERISQLEHENDILRANASPETLKQLNQSQKKFNSTHKQHQPPPS